jgi:hypothetical protein
VLFSAPGQLLGERLSSTHKRALMRRHLNSLGGALGLGLAELKQQLLVRRNMPFVLLDECLSVDIGKVDVETLDFAVAFLQERNKLGTIELTV